MNEIKINKMKLLEILKKNRGEHRDVFLEAQKNYRAEVIKVLDARLADARDGKRINLQILLVAPQDYTKEYDRAIRMLELSEDLTITIGESDFRAYVMDEWNWSRQWAASNSAYSTSDKLRQLQQEDDQAGS